MFDVNFQSTYEGLLCYLQKQNSNKSKLYNKGKLNEFTIIYVFVF